MGGCQSKGTVLEQEEPGHTSNLNISGKESAGIKDDNDKAAKTDETPDLKSKQPPELPPHSNPIVNTVGSPKNLHGKEYDLADLHKNDGSRRPAFGVQIYPNITGEQLMEQYKRMRTRSTEVDDVDPKKSLPLDEPPS